MPTLVLTPRFTADSQVLWLAAISLGWDVERLTSWDIPEEILRVEEPVLRLESLFGPTLAEKFGLRLLEPADDWLPRLPWEYLKRRVYLTTVEEARMTCKGHVFIKPPNDKSFPAGICRGQDIPDYVDPSSLVLVSEIVEWEMEFRSFILDRKVRALSIYMRDGQFQRAYGFRMDSVEAHDAREFIQRVISDLGVELGRTAVLDVGVIRGKGWAVVEQNAAWGSGVYGCSPESVLEVLRYSAEKIPDS